MISIETESAEQRPAVRRLTESAFAASEFGYHGESDLIDAVCAATDQALSLVAIQDGCVVGHVLFSPVSLDCRDRQFGGMGLAPMAVLPAFQGQGIGSRLVATGLRHLQKREIPFTVVAGHPEFYARFGFRPAADFGVAHGFAGMPQEVFLVHSDRSDALHDVSGGLVYYNSVFGPQHVDV